MKIKMIMAYSIENLTPAELIIVVYNKHVRETVRFFIKYTIYDFVLKGLITIQKKSVKSDSSDQKSAFFVKFDKKYILDKKLNLLMHEKEILGILSDECKWISFQEFVTKLSYFDNNKFRATSKKYKIEKHIVNELSKKRIIYSHLYKILGITLWKKNELTQKGMELREYLCLNRDIQINEYSWLQIKYMLFNLNNDFFDSTFFLEIDNSFDDYFQQALDYMDTVVAAPIHWLKTYPEQMEP